MCISLCSSVILYSVYLYISVVPFVVRVGPGHDGGRVSNVCVHLSVVPYLGRVGPGHDGGRV